MLYREIIAVTGNVVYRNIEARSHYHCCRKNEIERLVNNSM